MVTTTAKIQIRRGPDADFTGGSGVVLDEGEFGLVTDLRQVWIGYGADYFPAGNVRLLTTLDGLEDMRASGGDYSMGGNRITDLDDPADPKDAVNYRTALDLLARSYFEVTTRTLTIAANTGAAANVETDAVPAAPAADSLNAIAGAYTGFEIHYTAIRGSSQQVGVIVINDNGTNTDFTHSYTETPSAGSVGITFSVAISAGVRSLKYVTTAGSSIVFKFWTVKWA